MKTFILKGVFYKIGITLIVLSALLIAISFIVFTGYPDGAKALVLTNIIFLAFGLMGYYFFSREAGKLRLTNENIIKVKFGREKIIGFEEITEVQYSDRQIIPGFVIKSLSEKIVIPKTAGFNEIYEEIKVKLPEEIINKSKPIEFKIDTSQFKIGIPVALAIPALIMFLMYMAEANMKISAYISAGIFLIVVALALSETPPHKPIGFILHPDYIMLRYMFRKAIKIPATDMASAEIKEVTHTPVKAVHMPYAEKFIEIKFNNPGQKPLKISNGMATMFQTSLEKILIEIENRYLNK